jgi:hypothetical protein
LEITETAKISVWSGMLQIQSLATALSMQILSVYPDGNTQIRHLFNKTIKPWFPGYNMGHILPIMLSGFTNNQGCFQTNHFVALVNRTQICHVLPQSSTAKQVASKLKKRNGLKGTKQTCKKMKIDNKYNNNQPEVITCEYNIDKIHCSYTKDKSIREHLFTCASTLPNIYCTACEKLINCISKVKLKITLCTLCQNFKKKDFLSLTHTQYMSSGKIPDEILGLNRVEVQLISKVHSYITLVKLPVGGQFAQKGQMINYPFQVQDVCNNLPKGHEEFQIIRVTSYSG